VYKKISEKLKEFQTKNKIGRFTFANLKTYCKTTGSSQCGSSRKAHILTNEMEMHPEINLTCMVEYLTVVPRKFNGEEKFFNKCCPNNWINRCKRMMLDSFLFPYQKD
jgi:hypothetical protein